MAREKILKTCEICGKEYMGLKLTKTCSEYCRKEQDRMKGTERRERQKVERKRKKGMSELARINEAARAARMSYGQYVSLHENAGGKYGKVR